MSLIELIEKTAIVRKDPRGYITEALEMVNKGEVERYPTGAPSLKGVYEIALKMYLDSTSESAPN